MQIKLVRKMRAILITFLVFQFSLYHSQITVPDNLYIGENLYIEIPYSAKHKSSDKDITVESYIIEIGKPCNEGIRVIFEVLPEGILTRRMVVPGCSTPKIKISYINKNEDNKPIKIDQEKIQNLISYEELTMSSSIDNLLWIISKYKNVYILYDKNMAKKVLIEQLFSL